MSSKKNKELYSPSSLNMRGYNSKKSKYNMMYSNHSNGMEYSFDYALRRKLNYIFNYLLHPKYGRYTFIYDITEKIHNENSVINLYPYDKKLLSKEDRDYHLSLNPTKEISEDVSDEFSIRKNIDSYHMFYESVMVNMNDVETMIDDYYEYSKIESASHKTRDLTLLSTDIAIRNEDSNGRKVETIYDFLLDRCFELDINAENNMSMKKRDIKERVLIEESLKNDVKMRKIVEEIFVDKVSESFTNETGKNIRSTDSNVNITKKDKSNNVSDEISKLKESIKKVVTEHGNSFILNKECKKVTTSNDTPLKITNDSTGIIGEKDEHFISAYLPESTMKIEKDVYSSKSEKKEHDVEIEFGLDIDKMEKLPKPNLEFFDDDSVVRVVKTISQSKSILDIDNESPSTLLDKVFSKDISLNKDNRLEKNSDRVLDTQNQKEQYLSLHGAKELDIQHEQFLDNYGDKKLNHEAEFNIGKVRNREVSVEDINLIDKGIKGSFDTEPNEVIISKGVAKTLVQEFEERLDLHKRFWFVKNLGKVDYKILPNVDFNYPVDIEMFVEKPDFIYLFDFECEYKDIKSDSMTIDLYDYAYKKYESFKINEIKNGMYSNGKISVEIEVLGNKARFQIKINHDNLYYMIIRQPEDVNGYPVLYTVTKKFLGENHHPIPFGEDMGTREIPVHINVMVDFINILMLMWSRFYYQFTGYTGTQAVYGLLNLVYEWLTLETSSEIYDIEDYYRCFRWLRWEAEKIYNIARHDPELTGNAWVEKLIYELIEYMEMHHMDEMPVFEPIHLMDEYRNIFDDPSFDMDIVIEKVKGVRKKVIDTNKVRRNQK